MKKKYTLTVANSQINVVTEEPKEAIDTIVGVVDRKIREIHLHSPSCSRVDAAILLCLDYCADKLQLKKKLKQANAEIERLAVLNEAAARENAALEREIETLRRSLNMSPVAKNSPKTAAAAQLAFDDLGESENEPLVIITEDASDAVKAEEVKNEPAVVESAVDKILADEAPEEKDEPAEPAVTTEEDRAAKRGKKKKVRSMFDLISFDDI